MKIIVNKYIPFKGYSAMAIWPFVFIRKDWFPYQYLQKITDMYETPTAYYNECKKEVLITLNHERIHLEQQKELWFIGFWILYLLFWVFNIFKYWNFSKAYMQIPFEQEAYNLETLIKYLEVRKKFKWFKYI